MKKRVSQFVVAKHCGVSQSVVSAVFSNSTMIQVNDETRQKVVNAAKKLGYRQRFLSTNQWGGVKTHNIAWVSALVPVGGGVPSPAARSYESRYQTLMGSVVRHLDEQGFSLMVSNWDSADYIREWLTKNSVEGVVWRGMYHDAELFDWIKTKFPVVLLEDLYGTGTDRVIVNQDEIIAIAFKHLLEMGHTRICYFGHVPDSDLFQRRKLCYKELCDKNNLRIYTEFFQLSDAQDLPSPEKVSAILDCWQGLGKDRPTAIIINDFHAIHLLSEAIRRGIKVPEQLSIVGSDGVDMCQFTAPPLSTIEEDFNEMGRAAVELLLSRIEDPHRPPRLLMISPFLQKRQSVLDLREANATSGKP